MRVTWPLFWCLKPEDQAKLMQYHWDNFGTRMDIPPAPDMPSDDWKIVLCETPEELARLMRERPHLKGKGWHG